MKEKISLIYKIIIVIVTAIGLYLNFKFLSFRNGILYFTNISNVICLIYFLVLVIKILLKKEDKSDKHYIIKGTVTMAITLTFYMFNFGLRNDPTTDIFIGHDIECYFVHVLVPILVMFDYILFGEKGHLKKSYPFIWSSVLLLYQIFVILYVNFGGRFINNLSYPYSYMDVGTNGVFNVGLNMIGIFVAFILYGLVVQIVDNYVAKKNILIQK